MRTLRLSLVGTVILVLLGGSGVSVPYVSADDEDDRAEMKEAFESGGLKWFDTNAEAKDSGDDAGSDDTNESGIGMNAMDALADGLGGGDRTSDRKRTGDLNDPLAGGSDNSINEGETKENGSRPRTGEGSDPADPAESRVDPRFRVILELLLEDVRVAEAEAKAAKLVRAEDRANEENRKLTEAEIKAAGTLTEAERSTILVRSVQETLSFLQTFGLLGEVDERGLAEQIEGIPTDPEE